MTTGRIDQVDHPLHFGSEKEQPPFAEKEKERFEKERKKKKEGKKKAVDFFVLP